MSDRTKPPPGWELCMEAHEWQPYYCKKSGGRTFDYASADEAISEAWYRHDATQPAADELTAADLDKLIDREESILAGYTRSGFYAGLENKRFVVDCIEPEYAEFREWAEAGWRIGEFLRNAAGYDPAKARDLKSRAGGGDHV